MCELGPALGLLTWALTVGPVVGSNWTFSLGYEEPAEVGFLGLQNGLKSCLIWAKNLGLGPDKWVIPRLKHY